MLLDTAEEGEEGQRSPPYIAPGSRSPSPSALAALYTQVRGASDLSPATLETLERGRRSREEVTRRATRTRLILDQERRDKESTGERSRSRSSQRRQEQEQPAEEEKRRCKSASTWTPPRRRSASPPAQVYLPTQL